MAAAAEQHSSAGMKHNWEAPFRSFVKEIISRINALLNPIIEKMEEMSNKITHVE